MARLGICDKGDYLHYERPADDRNPCVNFRPRVRLVWSLEFGYQSLAEFRGHSRTLEDKE